MNTCICGRVVLRSATQCMSCAKKTAWARGAYGNQRERLRILRSRSEVERLSTPLDNCPPAGPRSTIDNALREAFRKVIGFDPMHDKNPAWKFRRQIDDEASDAA